MSAHRQRFRDGACFPLADSQPGWDFLGSLVPLARAFIRVAWRGLAWGGPGGGRVRAFRAARPTGCPRGKRGPGAARRLIMLEPGGEKAAGWRR